MFEVNYTSKKAPFFKIKATYSVTWNNSADYWFFFSLCYRITESQNSRGWKGPLWVI